MSRRLWLALAIVACIIAMGMSNAYAVNDVELSVATFSQTTDYTCSAASSLTVLDFFHCASFSNGTTPKDQYYYNNITHGDTNAVTLKNKLNEILQASRPEIIYDVKYCTNYNQYISLIEQSLRDGYPIMALIGIPDNDGYFHYYSYNGHYVVIAGIYESNGTVMLSIRDPFQKYLFNPYNSVVKIPASTMYNFAMDFASCACIIYKADAGKPHPQINEETFPDDNFRTLVQRNYSENGCVNTGVTTITIQDDPMSENYIYDLSGIEYFPWLETFICPGPTCKLTALDVSNNPKLVSLTCSFNRITSLDVTHNPLLKELYCSFNQLSSLDVSHNPALTNLDCRANDLTVVDTASNPLLTELICSENELTSLNAAANTALVSLGASNNKLTSLVLPDTSTLHDVSCKSNQLTELDLSKNTAVAVVYCGDNQITSLDFSGNTTLSNLYCSYNQLVSLDVTEATNLYIIDCTYNLLSSLDFSNNARLSGLFLSPQYAFKADGSPLGFLLPDWQSRANLKDLSNGGNIEMDRVTMTDGGQLDIPTGIVTYTSAPDYITYTYDTKAPGILPSQRQVSVVVPTDNSLELFGDSTIILPSTTFTSGGTISFTAAVYTLNDQRWVPVSWQTNPSGVWTSPPYTASFSTVGMSLGDHVLTVRFAHEIFNGTDWIRTGGTTSSALSYTIRGEIPQTGDSGHVVLWISLLAASLGAGAITAVAVGRKHSVKMR